MKLGLGFRHKLSANLEVIDGKYSLFPVRQQFDQMKARIVSGWNIEHKPDGEHANINADSLTLRSGNTGIVFPAAQSASTGVNTLDDYEEGSFTPTIGGATSTTGQTYTTQIGRYIKIGKLVFVFGTVTLSAKGTITGAVQLQGLPFTSENTISAVSTIHIGHFQGMLTNWIYLAGTLTENVTAAGIQGTSAAAGAMTVLAAADIGNATLWQFSGCYRAAA